MNSVSELRSVDSRRQGFFIVDNEIVDVYDLSLVAFAVYSHLVRWAGVKKPVLKINWFAKRFRIGRSKVREGLSELESRGLICPAGYDQDGSPVYEILPLGTLNEIAREFELLAQERSLWRRARKPHPDDAIPWRYMARLFTRLLRRWRSSIPHEHSVPPDKYLIRWAVRKGNLPKGALQEYLHWHSSPFEFNPAWYRREPAHVQ